jgi:DNA-binding transcriptional LysR family regulator
MIMPRHHLAFGRLSNIDIRLLRVFVAVVEQNGFASAQASLGVAGSTLSTDMANLEKRLGLTLCKRGRGGFAVTDAGTAIYRAIGKLFAAMDDFSTTVSDLRGQLAGEMRIGIIDNSVLDPSTRMPEVIARFSETFPEVHLQVEVLPASDIQSAVREGRLHIGVGVFGGLERGIAEELSFAEELDLYCGAEHPFFGRKDAEITASEVRAAHYAQGIYLTETPKGFTPSASAYQAEGLAFLVLSGRFVGYLPRRYAGTWVKAGMMRPLKPSRGPCWRPFSRP